MGSVGSSQLGEMLRRIRTSRGITLKETCAAIPTFYRYERSIMRLEKGARSPKDREHLIFLLVKGLRETSPTKINQILIKAGYERLSMTEELQHNLRRYSTTVPLPSQQLVRWGPDEGREAGILINSTTGAFIPWAELKTEIERRLLSQLANIPPGSIVKTDQYKGHRDFVVRVVSPKGRVIGSIWLGSDPYKDWAYDGLVRVGWSKTAGAPETVVWQIFQRYSDGSYHRITAYD